MATNEGYEGSLVLLTGFSDFLDWRPIQFVGSRPCRNVCDVCGVLSRRAKFAGCSHVFCVFCSTRIQVIGTRCPIDGKQICIEDAAEILVDEQEFIGYPVRCFNVDRGCKYEGILGNLKKHFMERCSYNQASCKKCGRLLARWQAAEHRIVCKVGGIPAAIRALQALDRVDHVEHKRRGSRKARDAPNRSKGAARPSRPSAQVCTRADADKAAAERRKVPESDPPLGSAADTVDGTELATESLYSARGSNRSDFLTDATSLTASETEVANSEAMVSKASPGSCVMVSAKCVRVASRSFVGNVFCLKARPVSTAAVDKALPDGGIADVSAQKNLSTPVKAATNLSVGTSSLLTGAPEDLATGGIATESSPQASPQPDKAVSRGSIDGRSCSPTERSILEVTLATDVRGSGLPSAGSLALCHAEAVQVPPCSATSIGKVQKELGAHSKQEPDVQGDISAQDDVLARSEATATVTAQTNTADLVAADTDHDYISESSSEILAESLSSLNTIRADLCSRLASELATEDKTVETLLPCLMSPTGAATCWFADVLHVRSALQNRGSVLILSDESMLSGYTFQTSCRFQRRGTAIFLVFELSFCSGDCDSFCQWPFDKRIIFQLVHPQDSAMNFAVTPRADAPASAYAKPQPNSSNPSIVTGGLSWNYLELTGFVADGVLRIDTIFQ